MIKIKKGLDLPISGEPPATLSQQNVRVDTVAVLGSDYIGLKPTMLVEVGDMVTPGQPLFTDKKTHGVQICAPAGGKVIAINRGARRFLESVVIAIDPELDSKTHQTYEPMSTQQIELLSDEQIVDALSSSGFWSAFRTRPFSKVPATDSRPVAIFVNTMDTNPLAADPMLFISAHKADFEAGLKALTRLGAPVHLCGGAKLSDPQIGGVQTHQFEGKHPAGNAGTHIHFVRPAARQQVVWTIAGSDVVSIGKLFTKGELFFERYISVAGPKAKSPKIVKSRLGASLDALTFDQDVANETRVISGSIWNGRIKSPMREHLGRYNNQVTLIHEGTEREYLGWINMGKRKFSVLQVTLGSLIKSKREFTTTTNGSERAMVPIGQYEKVMPLDILPTQLLRSLIVGDIVQAMELGCLELSEEDLALCTFVCSGKYEYGPILRDNLSRIEKET